MVEIIPAVLERDNESFIKKVISLPSEAEFVHIDMLESDVWEPIGRKFEVHLMVKNPGAIMERWLTRGAARLIVHEVGEEMLSRKGEAELGFALEMHAPVEAIEPFADRIDFLQLMSIAEIGEQGHPLDDRIFDRIREAKRKFPDLTISVDGGINASNYEKLIEAGADRLVVGSGFKELWQTLQTKK